MKLRKLLEDVHLESEETAHHLRKKHQEIVVDFQDQIDQLSKARARSVSDDQKKKNRNLESIDHPRLRRASSTPHVIVGAIYYTANSV